MPRRRERALMVTALGIGLAGMVLVAVAGGATLEAGLTGRPELTVPAIALLWGQLALAALLCHLVLARRHRGADQVLLPLSLGLTGLGVTIIFSLAPGQAQKQVNWLWVSLAVLLLTVTLRGDIDRFRDYRYLFGLLTAVLLLMTMVLGHESHGARLWLKLGPIALQPGELAKVTLVFFLAGYLDSRGDMLVDGGRRVLGIELPDPRYLGPVVLMWGFGMVLLVGLRDLGTALLFFGTFLSMMYAATAQAGYLWLGGAGFAGGLWICSRLFHHVRIRLDMWQNPWPEAQDKGYQIVQGLFAIAAGGVGGVGLGLGGAERIPAATTDYPFAALCEELGLWGAAMAVALFGVWVYRALRLGASHPNRYRALLSTGIGCLMAVQTLVILGGVTKLIPLTGITLPFISYGGSSLVTNYLLLGLLLRCSEGAR
ncbi:MAG: FtsW/RodA/SpoVE family cell cycle protein [Armatimonadetes bacterium]|nr:FtsW/RodA/SpoVE family cell cycle protein [Armatimonadota bacterium]